MMIDHGQPDGDWREDSDHDTYVGEDAGCVTLTVWRDDTKSGTLEVMISGEDVDLDRAGVKRLGEIMLAQLNQQIEAAKETER